MTWFRRARFFYSAVAFLIALAVCLSESPAGASTNQHIVDKKANISFFAPRGFVHESIASFFWISDFNSRLGIEILIQNPGGAVTIADGDTWLNGWLGKTDLTFGSAKYVHKPFGRVADIAFSNQQPNEEYRLYGRDLRFSDGSRSYDVLIDSPNPSAAIRTANLLLATWGT